MNEIKLLHCADIHIGAHVSTLGTKAEQRRSEILLTFERIVQLARSEQVPLVLIAGDLFDSLHVEKSTSEAVISALGAAEEVQFVIAAGNHDPLCDSNPLCSSELKGNLHLLGAEDCFVELPELGVRVYGRSLRPGTDTGRARFSLVPDDSFINLMCLHGDTGAASSYNHITDDFIRESGMDYVALGHIHKRSELRWLGPVPYAYCGSPEGLGFDEEGERGIYSVTVSKGRCEASFIPLCRRRFLSEQVDISGCASAAEVAERVCERLRNLYGEGFRDHLYRITLCGEQPVGIGSLSEIKTRLGDVLYYAEITSIAAPAIDLDALALERSLRGIFVRRMTEKMNSASDESERGEIKKALHMGLSAFSGEVILDENN